MAAPSQLGVWTLLLGRKASSMGCTSAPEQR